MGHPDADIHGPFARGYRVALDDVYAAHNTCKAYNPDPDIPYRLCVKHSGHGGKHDDLWKPPWGDKNAKEEQNRADARAHRIELNGFHPVTWHVAAGAATPPHALPGDEIRRDFIRYRLSPDFEEVLL